MNNAQPTHFLIQVEETYKGEIVNKDFLDKNPQIASQFPSQSDFMKKYLSVKYKAEETNKKYKIIVSENGIETIEL